MTEQQIATTLYYPSPSSSELHGMHAAERVKKDTTIAQVADSVRERLSGPRAQAAEQFARHYFAGVATEDLLGKQTEDLSGAMLSHWRLALRRKPGRPSIHIYNPIPEEHGWQSPHTVVEIVTDDMPFLVDSVSQELNRYGLTIHLIIHPVMRVRRGPEGELQEVLAPSPDGDGITEAVMHFEVDQEADSEILASLRADLQKVLSDVRVVVEDWPRMRLRLREVVSVLKTQPLPVFDEEIADAVDWLRWIDNHHFTFIGFRTFDLVEEEKDLLLRLVPGSGLGIFRDSTEQRIPIPPNLHAAALAKELLIITKSTARSTVHRPAHLDHVGIKRFDDVGNVIGEWRFQGLYSSLVHSTRPSEIPLLKRKVAKVLERAALPPDSHDGRTLQNILDHLPRDEMFQATVDELYNIAMGILNLQERARLKLFIRRDIYGRFVSALVFAPRDRYNTTLRLRFQEILMQAFGGVSSEFDVQFSESVLARVYFIIRTPLNATVDWDVAELEARMAEAMLSWEDRLRNTLLDQLGEAQGKKLWQRFRQAFPAGYQEDFSAHDAVVDIKHLEELSRARPLITNLYRPLAGLDWVLRFKVFGRSALMALSDVLPILEHMGLRVLAARPYEIEPRKTDPAWILDFDMTTARGMDVELLDVQDIFQDAFTRIVSGEIENDGFNRLVLAAELSWREIVVLRAIAKYLLQTPLPLSQVYMEQSLANNASIARKLVELFMARLDPASQAQSEPAVVKLKGQIEQALQNVTSLDEDRILRSFLALILATLRTNYFQKDAGGNIGKSYLAFKLDPAGVPELPLPLPMFEIFVYARWMEGVHLRGGRVARGGIRWSDRREDFRTEVLGLMKAQMVKNAVIVPTGAKGGFVCKSLPPPDNRDAVQREVVRCYRTFIRGLLDLTDNRVDGAIQPPPDVVRYDGDDPYLVVAADKGTAVFSDIANELAYEYQFWLGNAFASGGRHGYDHKEMGITARGAWECVARHFRELGVDVQTTPFTAVGIGDMSGDVFGNGMLQWTMTSLIAAFDHRHIFIDPNPDAERAYAERRRLFKLPRSSWDDYNRDVISKGGGVYPRSAKSILLSTEARTALGTEAERLIPNELIKAILRAPVDLLWNGGIGTYVKASNERHADVGDRSNDNLRIDAAELRCRVLGEGGNLGLTQLARIEFAARGALINTDAIDNAGGVDCSDHEVNIKILLNRAVASGKLEFQQRNELLAGMTDEVAKLVLRDNYLQSQAISIANSQAAELLSDHSRLIGTLEREGLLKRKLESLPNEEEITKREAAKTGLTRPELAVLLAYGKIQLNRELADSDIAGDLYLSRELQGYFPATLRTRFTAEMEDHPLRREIIATHLTNDIVNRMGSTFCIQVQERTGDRAADIARAYWAAREIFRARVLWTAIEALDNKIQAATQLDMMVAVNRLLDRATVWLLRNRRTPLDIAATVEYFAEDAEKVRRRIPRLLHGSAREFVNTRLRQLCSAGVPHELALHVACLDILFAALNVVTVARTMDMEIQPVADAYFELGFALSFDWLHERIHALPALDHWQRSARAMLRDELNAELRELTLALLRLTRGAKSSRERIERWLERNKSAVAHYRSVIADLQSLGKTDLAMLSVAVREVRSLARDGNNAT
jgi:glutamate dehydrogenase